MDAFLELFGEINVATIVTYLIALGFVAATYRKFKSYLIEKNDTEKIKDKKIMSAKFALIFFVLF